MMVTTRSSEETPRGGGESTASDQDENTTIVQQTSFVSSNKLLHRSTDLAPISRRQRATVTTYGPHARLTIHMETK